MPTSEEPSGASGRRSRRTRVVVSVAVFALVTTGGLLYAGGAADRWLSPEADSPAEVDPPKGLELPSPPVPPEVSRELTDGRLDRGAVRRALGRLPDDRRLGGRVAVTVATRNGDVVLRRGPTVVTPASTLKLLTGVAALASVGPETTFVTQLVRRGRTLTLVGGGDPLLATQPAEGDDPPDRADLATLARRAADVLPRRGRPFTLTFDATLFAGPDVNPAWEDDYVPDDVVSPIVPLWADQGREDPREPERVEDPARAAAEAFLGQLRRQGVPVEGPPEARPAASAAEPVAQVRSAELVEIVEHMVAVSDNETAEVLARHVALAEGRPPSFEGAARAVTGVLRRLGVGLGGATVLDGSGLARGNRLPVRAIVETLALTEQPELNGVLRGLPVAGFTGSLSLRFTEGASPGVGRVEAKTGTLSGVHGLAGTVVGRDGSVMVLVAVADRVPLVQTLFARGRLDRMAAALTECRCGRP